MRTFMHNHTHRKRAFERKWALRTWGEEEADIKGQRDYVPDGWSAAQWLCFRIQRNRDLGTRRRAKGRGFFFCVCERSGHPLSMGSDTKLTIQFLAQIKAFFGVIAIVLLSSSDGRGREREVKGPDVRIIGRVLHAAHWRNILASAFVGVS